MYLEQKQYTIRIGSTRIIFPAMIRFQLDAPSVFFSMDTPMVRGLTFSLAVMTSGQK